MTGFTRGCFVNDEAVAMLRKTDAATEAVHLQTPLTHCTYILKKGNNEKKNECFSFTKLQKDSQFSKSHL